jgi:hypothetical protein
MIQYFPRSTLTSICVLEKFSRIQCELLFSEAEGFEPNRVHHLNVCDIIIHPIPPSLLFILLPPPFSSIINYTLQTYYPLVISGGRSTRPRFVAYPAINRHKSMSDSTTSSNQETPSPAPPIPLSHTPQSSPSQISDPNNRPPVSLNEAHLPPVHILLIQSPQTKDIFQT